MAMRPLTAEDTWTPQAAQLYHLGTGGGLDQCGQTPLPTFATRAFEALRPALRGRLVEHEVVLLAPLQLPRSVFHQGQVSADGSRTRVTIRTRSAAGELLAINAATVAEDGAGVAGAEPPAREPDATVELPALAERAHLYRLCLPGAGTGTASVDDLAVFGAVVRAAVDSLLGGDPAGARACRAIFGDRLRPGETLVARFWARDGSVVGDAIVPERKATVLAGVRLSASLE